jgi:hypothetical protein
MTAPWCYVVIATYYRDCDVGVRVWWSGTNRTRITTTGAVLHCTNSWGLKLSCGLS